MEITQEKAELRKKLLTQRQSLSSTVRDHANRQIAKAVIEHPVVQLAQVIMLYIDFRDEVSTSLIRRDLWKQGKRVVAPRTQVHERALIPLQIQNDDELVKGAYGIDEPLFVMDRIVAPEEIDVVLIPGAAFDVGGRRLGYGGGYYDRFLPTLRSDAVTIGIAFEFQLVEHVPAEVHDIRVDWIITESGIYQST